MTQRILLLPLALLLACPLVLAQAAAPTRPNIILILADDLGYGDLGCHGSPTVRTPHLDRLAAEGTRFTNAYAFPTCSPSRAALLTGRYPPAVGIPMVLGPAGPKWTTDRQVGLDPAGTTTVAELLRGAGYRTGMIGKWHLGHFQATLPTAHGFDSYFGIPYSNDMLPPGYPDLPVFDGERVLSVNPAQDTLTEAYHRRALAFVDAAHRAGEPFFLYLAHHLPHVPLHGTAAFAGAPTPFAAALAEVDAGVGRLSAKLDSLGIAEETLVIFLSDNGPWLVYGGEYAGSAGPFREGKGTSFEGGVRVPMLWRWPGTVPAGGVAHHRASLLDVVPTLAELLGVPTPADVDGRSLVPVLRDPRAAPERTDAHFYWRDGQLEAVRRGRYKLHLPHDYVTIVEPGAGGNQGRARIDSIGIALFDLLADPGERDECSAAHPEVVAELRRLAEEHVVELPRRSVGPWVAGGR